MCFQTVPINTLHPHTLIPKPPPQPHPYTVTSSHSHPIPPPFTPPLHPHSHPTPPPSLLHHYILTLSSHTSPLTPTPLHPHTLIPHLPLHSYTITSSHSHPTPPPSLLHHYILTLSSHTSPLHPKHYTLYLHTPSPHAIPPTLAVEPTREVILQPLVPLNHLVYHGKVVSIGLIIHHPAPSHNLNLSVC